MGRRRTVRAALCRATAGPAGPAAASPPAAERRVVAHLGVGRCSRYARTASSQATAARPPPAQTGEARNSTRAAPQLACLYRLPAVRTSPVLYAGTAAPGHQDGPRESAAFTKPRGLCVDSVGAVFVAEPASATVRRIDGRTGMGVSKLNFIWLVTPPTIAAGVLVLTCRLCGYCGGHIRREG